MSVRLSTDIQGLKHFLWEKTDDTNLDELVPEDVAEDAVRWTYTSSMKMDYLTKRMRPKVVLKFKASEEDVLSKTTKQKQRAAKKVATHTDQTIPNGCVVAYSNRS